MSKVRRGKGAAFKAVARTPPSSIREASEVLEKIQMEKEEMISKSKFFSKQKEFVAVYQAASQRQSESLLRESERAFRRCGNCSESMKKT